MAAFAFVAWVEGTWPGDTPAPDGVAAWFAAARPVQGWATMVALVGIAAAWGNRDHRWSTTLAEAVFPFYIVHQAVIVVVGWFLVQSGVARLAVFLNPVAARVPGCWAF